MVELGLKFIFIFLIENKYQISNKKGMKLEGLGNRWNIEGM